MAHFLEAINLPEGVRSSGRMPRPAGKYLHWIRPDFNLKILNKRDLEDANKFSIRFSLCKASHYPFTSLKTRCPLLFSTLKK